MSREKVHGGVLLVVGAEVRRGFPDFVKSEAFSSAALAFRFDRVLTALRVISIMPLGMVAVLYCSLRWLWWLLGWRHGFLASQN